MGSDMPGFELDPSPGRRVRVAGPARRTRQKRKRTPDSSSPTPCVDSPCGSPSLLHSPTVAPYSTLATRCGTTIAISRCAGDVRLPRPVPVPSPPAHPKPVFVALVASEQ